MRELPKTCCLYGIPPPSYDLNSTLSKPGQQPFASGGISDLWKLTDKKDSDRVFAVKSFHRYEYDPVTPVRLVRTVTPLPRFRGLPVFPCLEILQESCN